MWMKSTTEVMRDALIDLFCEAGPAPLSGTDLSEQLGVTRTAVWKHIQTLQQLGFRFESSPRVGHRLLHVPDVLVEPLLTRALPADVELGRTVTFHADIDSTNRLAGDLARAGAPHGTLVTALRQTGGRGRRGRVWFSPPDGAWLSIVLQRPLALQRAAELTLIASVVLRRVCHALSGCDVRIKWPNDLLVGGRKVCGILAEIRADGEQVQRTVLGIGVNCNTPAADFPEDIRPIATSLFAQSGVKIDRVELVARFLASFQPYYDALVAGQPAFEVIHREWTDYSHTLGKVVRVQTGNQFTEGVAIRLEPSGTLILRTATDEEQAIHSGDVLFDV